MEKKTIGKFISTLRKAIGMTQKELGEKLFVSDKTVSRWERDECTPELSLIPSIAELFDITIDELLRGERNNPENVDDIERAERQRSKSDKHFKLMLDSKGRKYKNLTLISIGITILGFIAAMIANLAFSEGLIAFCLAVAFGVASEICQICFAINAWIMIDEDNDTYKDRIESLNTNVVKTAVKISFFNIILFAFCLPLVTLIDGANFGLHFDYWIGYATLFTIIVLPFSYVFYALFVRKILCDRRLLIFTNQQKSNLQINNMLLKKILAYSICFALVLGIGITVLNNIGIFGLVEKIEFDNCNDFKAFMENEYDKWLEEGYSYTDLEGNVVIHIPVESAVEFLSPDDEKVPQDKQYPKKIYSEIRDFGGEVLCEYYYNPDLYEVIRFNESAEDKMPATVITKQAYYDARNTFQMIESTLYFLIVIDFVIATGIYHKRKKTL